MSTIKVTNIDPPSAGGAVNINGVSYPNAGPLSNRNLIINGAMQVAQRGTSSTLGTYGTVDRFQPAFVTGAQTQTQETLTSGSPYDEGFRYFLRIANTTASTSANTLRQFATKLEAQTIAQSGWNYTSSTSYVTVSFWVRASVEQEYYAYLLTSDGTEYKYPFSLGTLAASTWTKITKTIPGNSNLTVNNDNGEGLRLVVSPFYGTDYTDSGVSVDTWATYSASTRTPDYTNTWGGTTDATFDVTGVQLEVGSVATPFEHRSYGDELARCQRYYYMIGNSVNAPICTGAIYSANNFYGVLSLPTTMRTAPSIDVTNAAGHFTVFSDGTGDNCNTCLFTVTRDNQVEINITSSQGLSGATQSHAAWVRVNSNDAHLAATAEL